MSQNLGITSDMYMYKSPYRHRPESSRRPGNGAPSTAPKSSTTKNDNASLSRASSYANDQHNSNYKSRRWENKDELRGQRKSDTVTPVARDGISTCSTQKRAIDVVEAKPQSQANRVLESSIKATNKRQQSDEKIVSLSRPERIFRDKVDNHSLAEILDMLSQLNGRIDTLVLTLLGEHNRLIRLEDNKATDKSSFKSFIKEAIGKQLLDPMTEAWRSEAFSDHLFDTWQACVVFCVYSALRSLLFGIRIRDATEFAGAIHQMEDTDAELAKYWSSIYSNLTSERSTRVDSETFAEHIDPYAKSRDLSWFYDSELIFDTLCSQTQDDELRAIPLHWRALLCSAERQLQSYSKSYHYTIRILRYGLLEVYNLVGLPFFYRDIDRALIEKACADVVFLASRLADMIKIGFFSANLEVVRVEPGVAYDSSTMDCDDVNADHRTVAGTIYLGLSKIGAGGRVEVLVKPKVLLA